MATRFYVRSGSPVSDGGRGLKLGFYRAHGVGADGFARQRWRAWIETWRAMLPSRQTPGSPVSDGGRGLKPMLPNLEDKIELVRPSAMAGVD